MIYHLFQNCLNNETLHCVYPASRKTAKVLLPTSSTSPIILSTFLYCYDHHAFEINLLVFHDFRKFGLNIEYLKFLVSIEFSFWLRRASCKIRAVDLTIPSQLRVVATSETPQVVSLR